MENFLNSETLLTRSPSRSIRVFNFPQILSATVEAESSLEEDFVNRAVLFPRLTQLISQPFVLPISPLGYTPDYFVKTETGHRFVVEVKIERKVQGYASLFADATEYLNAKGINFLVVTEKAIRSARIHMRARRILRYLKAQYPIFDCQRVVDEVATHPGGLTIGQLLINGTSPELIFHLIASHKLATDPRLILDEDALVFDINHMELDHEDSFVRWLGVTSWGKDV